jgi:hypothetical protein
VSILNLAVERLSESVLGYFNIWRYLDALLKHRLSGASTHRLRTAGELYSGIANNLIRHGDRVILEEIFVTEWVPRLPGAINAALRRGLITAADTELITSVAMYKSVIMDAEANIPPFGSVRLPLQDNRRVALGAVGASEFHADLGAVLSVTPTVYAEFLRKKKGQAAVEGTVEGTVELYAPPRDLPSAGILVKNLDGVVTEPPFVIAVDSPLQVRFRLHDAHPRVTAWSIRRIHHRERGQGYDFFYTFIEPEPEQMMLARDLIRDSSVFVNMESVVSEFSGVKELLAGRRWSGDKDAFVRKHLKEFRCITEFDARGSGLDPLVPLGTDPRVHVATIDTTTAIVNDMRDGDDTRALTQYQRHRVVQVPPQFTAKCDEAGLDIVFDPYPSRFQPLRSGCYRFPPDDRMPCPHCGKIMDLSEARRDIEEMVGIPIPRIC